MLDFKVFDWLSKNRMYLTVVLIPVKFWFVTLSSINDNMIEIILKRICFEQSFVNIFFYA